ncbi:hypothetical protein HRbin33_00597 [bacterium HR33]|nr:hypothetical protein HRbin33_00597 [bacterium HR33]
MSQDRLDLEELAAFVDGRLEGEARARVIRLLASSEEAYEVFAETLRFQAEERARGARVVRFPRWRRAVLVPLAAAAALALLLVQDRWLGTPQPEALSGARLVRQLDLSPAAVATLGAEWDRHPWSVTRGGAARLDESELAFRLGMRSADLAAALRMTDYTGAERLAAEIVELLEGVELSQPVTSRYVDLRAKLEQGESLQSLLEAAERSEQSLSRLLDSPQFDLGRWCAAASLAVRLRNQDLFRSPGSRAFLEGVDRLGLEASDLEALRRIAALTSGVIGEAEYRELQALLEAIIQRNAG